MHEFESIRSSKGDLSLIEITMDLVLFSRKFQMQLSALREWMGVKCGKLNFRKSQGIYYISFENCP